MILKEIKWDWCTF